MRRILFALIAVGAFGLSGCGTFADAMCGPVDDHVYYRGVRLDVQAAKEGGAKLLLLADIPLSAVADTLLIPHYAQIARDRDIYSRRRRETTPTDPNDLP